MARGFPAAWCSWDAAQLVVETSAGRTTLDAGKLASVTPQQSAGKPAAKPAVWVDLVDGSQLAAAEYTAEKGRAKIIFSASEVLEVPTAEIDAVRFQPTSEATALEWSRIRGQKIRGDVLVTGNSSAIDYHEGAIEDVSDEKARFILDGAGPGVKRAKIFGLIYFHATAASTPECPYTIVDSAGSRWAAASLKLSEDKIEFTSPGGRTTRRGLDQIAKIDLSCGKIVYLSDLKPDAETFTPYPFTVTGKRTRQPPGVLAGPPRPESRIEVAADPRADLPQGTGPAQPQRAGLDLARQVQPLGGEWPASTTTSARLGNVRLQILGDGKTLLDANIAGNDKDAQADQP